MGGSSIRLALIGGNIAESKAPELHAIAGGLCGLPVSYELLRPDDFGRSFEDELWRCRDAGFRGVNITYPYKERVVGHLAAADSAVSAMGACNTVLFEPGGPRGLNTDYSGFVAAYRNTFGSAPPGRVALAGAGGVGRAIGFALAWLGAEELRLFDLDRQKAGALADAIRAVHGHTLVRLSETVAEAARGADGLVNATPLGMGGIGGCPFPADLIAGQRWGFDSIYTPVDTPFMLAARAAGVTMMSGYELFLYQGIDAFRHFTGCNVAEDRLRAELMRAHDRIAV
ncbi:MAG: shikimate dehydrogenase [Pseudolabrys sp.]